MPEVNSRQQRKARAAKKMEIMVRDIRKAYGEAQGDTIEKIAAVDKFVSNQRKQCPQDAEMWRQAAWLAGFRTDKQVLAGAPRENKNELVTSRDEV